MDGGCPPQVYMSCGAFIPPMVCAWSMHRPFVKHACIPGHSHSLHNHPGGPQDDGMTPSSHHARLPPSAPLPPLLSSLSLPSCTHCTPKCVPSASPQSLAAQHIMNSSGSIHEMRSVKVDKCYIQFDLSSHCPFPIVLSGGLSYV